MSRIYRISVSETLRTGIEAGDRIRQSLDLLPILPSDEMQPLLAAALAKRGFRLEGDLALIEEEDLVVEIDCREGTLEARIHSSKSLNLEREKSISVDEENLAGDERQRREKEMRHLARKELEDQAEEKREDLRREATRILTAKLLEIRDDVESALSETAKEALKLKAARIGDIEEIREEGDDSVTITIRV